MNDPAAKAKWVLESKGITSVPALSLGEIARQENIKFKYCDFPDELWLDGMLLSKGNKKAIIINTNIPNTGKHHFTFAHELGHYFLKHPPSYYQDDQSGFRCTYDDIKKEKKPYEVEANRFAVELLMPQDDFRMGMIGAPLDFGLVTNLSNHYMVSKHACSNRILELTHSPCIVILTKECSITGWTTSRAARGMLKTLNVIPEGTMAYSVISNRLWQKDFVTCNSVKWVTRTIPGNEILECTHIHRESGNAMIILKW